MSKRPKILAFAGASRSGSYNKKLIRVAAAGATEAGAEVTLINLEDYALPLFDGDLESAEGLPENGRKLKDLFIAHDGIMIASPEYNSSFSALLKNTIDWISRPVSGQPPFEALEGKFAVLMSASPGQLGGLRGLLDLRKVLGMIRLTVLPDQVAISQADKAFAEDGRLIDEKKDANVRRLGATLADVLRKLRP